MFATTFFTETVLLLKEYEQSGPNHQSKYLETRILVIQFCSQNFLSKFTAINLRLLSKVTQRNYSITFLQNKNYWNNLLHHIVV